MSKYYKAEDIFQVIDKIIQNATEIDADTIMGTDLVIEINKLPTIDLEEERIPPSTGHWIEHDDGTVLLKKTTGLNCQKILTL